jgi:hypothetical protein
MEEKIKELKQEIEALWDQYDNTDSIERRIFIKNNLLKIQKQIDYFEYLQFEEKVKEHISKL